ncbi:hypothetical protein DFH29DRAFT_1009944 [Suillus ampliporus]|nr:hypothetical protein DFH29DRAFT_1009944 [Suillus ampliporus]
MYMATIAMGDLLKRSITNKESSNWRTQGSNFQPPDGLELTPGCINITPCWFQQGYEVSPAVQLSTIIDKAQCYGPPPENPDEGFKPVVSASLEGDKSLSMIMDMQRPTLLASVALQSAEQGLHDMHHLLKHWASVYTGTAIMCNRQSPKHRDPKCPPKAFDILTSIGSYQHAVMQLANLRIELIYNPGIMVSYSSRLVRHGICVDQGDQVVWAWFLRDSMYNYAGTPCPDYAVYNPVDLDTYQLAKYNQADFAMYGNL